MIYISALVIFALSIFWASSMDMELFFFSPGTEETLRAQTQTLLEMWELFLVVILRNVILYLYSMDNVQWK